MFGNQIAGKISSEGKRIFYSFNPSLNQQNTSAFPIATNEEVEHALALSKNSFYSFSSSKPSDRSKLLELIAEELALNKSIISKAYCKESGLLLSRFEIEFKRTYEQLFLFSNFLKKPNFELLSETLGDQKNSLPHLVKKHVSIGPIVVFGASNFPLAYSTVGGDTVSAIAAGCPVIVKAHPFHPETSFLVGQAINNAIEKTLFPPGIFSQLYDDQFTVAHQLVRDNRIKGVAFTGSYLGGKTLFDLANSRSTPIPVFAEMGSLNPVFVFPTSLQEKSEGWSTLFSKSITNDAGQFCTKPGLFFIPRSENGKRFVSMLSEKLIQEPSFTMLHPSIHANFEKKKQEIVDQSKGELIEKKESIAIRDGRQGLFVTSASEFLETESLEKEVFGPFAVICYYDTQNQLKECTEKISGQLTATILATQEELIENQSFVFMVNQLAGRIIFNNVPTGVRVCESMHHGGPYPATTDSRLTAVGTDSILRFTRPIVHQDNC